MSFTVKAERERNGLAARQEAFKTALRAQPAKCELSTVRNLTYRHELLAWSEE